MSNASAEHVRLYLQITETDMPAAPANGTPTSQHRADILAPARLHDLYQRQNKPLAEIAATAGCATATIRKLLELDGVRQRPNYRQPPPDSGITREWLQHHYLDKQTQHQRAGPRTRRPPPI